MECDDQMLRRGILPRFRKNHVAALWELCTNKEKMGTFSEGVDITGYISEVQKTIFSLLLLGNSSQAHNAG